MHDYVEQTITSEDLAQNESGSSFTDCVFDGLIESVNLAYTLFVRPTFNGMFYGCNFASAEGDVPPPIEPTLEYPDGDLCNRHPAAMTRSEYLASLPTEE